MFRECLSIAQDVKGTDHDSLDIADCLKGIGKSLPWSDGRSAENWNLLWKSFEIMQRLYGDSADDFQLVVNALDELVDCEPDCRVTEDVRVAVEECLGLARHLHGENVDHEPSASSILAALRNKNTILIAQSIGIACVGIRKNVFWAMLLRKRVSSMN